MSFFPRFFEAKRKLFWAFASITLLLDQLSKSLLWRPPGAGARPLVLIPRVLRIVQHEGNVRGALGIGPTSPIVYIIAAVVGLLVIAMLFLTTEPQKGLVYAALGSLAGGAVGNLIDRASLGRVRDFIDLHWDDVFHWHTFNVADAAICLGLALIVWDFFLSKDQQPAAGEGRSGPA